MKIQRAEYHKNSYESRKVGMRSKHLARYWPGTTPDEAQIKYDLLLVNQNNCCALCQTHQSNLTKSLFVDHCHDTGAIRGLLCVGCNTALGALGDNVNGLLKAVEYLKKTQQVALKIVK